MDTSNKTINKKLIIGILVILVIAISYPALFMKMPKGHDLEFHLQRIEGILKDISWRNIPVRMQSKWVNEYGCPISIFYGDVFLYIAAAMRLVGISIMTTYRIFILIISAATVTVSYFSFRSLFDSKIAVVCTALYATASYRLVDVYVRAALGETLTIIFLPAVAAGMFVLLSSDADERKRNNAVITLALALAAIICSHVLTTSMTLVVFIPSGIAGLLVLCEKKERLNRVVRVIVSGVLAVLVAMYFIVPFIDFLFFGDIAVAQNHNIQGEGLRLSDFFRFFANPYHMDVSGGIQKTPGITLMLFLIGAFVYLIVAITGKVRFENHRRIVIETVVSCVILFMTTQYFPWNYIEKNLPLGESLTAIEFPMRYLVFAIVFLTFLAGDIMAGLPDRAGDDGKIILDFAAKYVKPVIMCLCLLNMVVFCVYTAKWDKKAEFATVEDLGKWQYYSMDYQLNNTGYSDDMPLGLVHEGMLSMEVLSRSRNEFLVACVTGPEYGWVQFPVFNYKYYHAEDLEDPSKEFILHDGGNRTVGVLLPANYSGILHVYWQEPVGWRIAEIVSFISFIGCMVFLYHGNNKKTKK